MKRTSLKKFLKEYSIFAKRKTTISHAFASAATPLERYDDENTAKALKLLGQNPNGDLQCIYCKRPAKTWDHLISLVENGEIREGGYGHQLGNLVPCCKDCNSDKQNKNFRVFVTDKKLVQRLEKYQQRFATVINVKACEKRMRSEWEKY